ncbi:unnamed protein product [Calypogeia fissa]
MMLHKGNLLRDYHTVFLVVCVLLKGDRSLPHLEIDHNSRTNFIISPDHHGDVYPHSRNNLPIVWASKFERIAGQQRLAFVQGSADGHSAQLKTTRRVINFISSPDNHGQVGRSRPFLLSKTAIPARKLLIERAGSWGPLVENQSRPAKCVDEVLDLMLCSGMELHSWQKEIEEC